MSSLFVQVFAEPATGARLVDDDFDVGIDLVVSQGIASRLIG